LFAVQLVAADAVIGTAIGTAMNSSVLKISSLAFNFWIILFISFFYNLIKVYMLFYHSQAAYGNQLFSGHYRMERKPGNYIMTATNPIAIDNKLIIVLIVWFKVSVASAEVWLLPLAQLLPHWIDSWVLRFELFEHFEQSMARASEGSTNMKAEENTAMSKVSFDK
jgi:hypothetical protein